MPMRGTTTTRITIIGINPPRGEGATPPPATTEATMSHKIKLTRERKGQWYAVAKPLYGGGRVWFGPYPSKEGAKDAAHRIKQSH